MTLRATRLLTRRIRPGPFEKSKVPIVRFQRDGSVMQPFAKACSVARSAGATSGRATLDVPTFLPRLQQALPFLWRGKAAVRREPIDHARQGPREPGEQLVPVDAGSLRQLIDRARVQHRAHLGRRDLLVFTRTHPRLRYVALTVLVKPFDDVAQFVEAGAAPARGRTARTPSAENPAEDVAKPPAGF